MNISYRELQRLAGEVDELHNAQMRTFREEMADVHLDAVKTGRITAEQGL